MLYAQFDLAELLAGMKNIERLWLSSSAGCCFTGLNACGRTLQRLDLEIAGVPPAALDLSGLEQLRRCARVCRWPTCIQTWLNAQFIYCFAWLPHLPLLEIWSGSLGPS